MIDYSKFDKLLWQLKAQFANYQHLAQRTDVQQFVADASALYATLTQSK